MNAQRLNELYSNIHIAEKSDIESIKQLTVDYPFYYLPYVVLAKYYYDTSHYKFEDMLRQAAMRVRDRRELYHYIHGNVARVEPSIDPDTIKFEEPEAIAAEENVSENQLETFLMEEANGAGSVVAEPIQVEDEPVHEEVRVEARSGINEFLEDFGEAGGKKPEEFVFEGRQQATLLEDIEIDNELSGEEIHAEFSFSKSFHIPEELVEETPAEVEEISVETGSGPEQENSSETIIGEDLRKSPVYNVEAFVGEGTIDNVEDDLSPERDFFAWLQHPHYTRSVKEETKEEQSEKDEHKIDLIDKFITVNPTISRPKKEFYNPENMAKKSEVIDLEYVTETLANIYYEQGNLDLAIKAYKKLSLQNPPKEAYFASLIEKIKKEKK